MNGSAIKVAPHRTQSPPLPWRGLAFGVVVLLVIGFISLLLVGTWATLEAIRRPAAMRDAAKRAQEGAAKASPLDNTISLGQAVNDFNKRYHEAAAAAKQPDLTVEAVLAAIRSAMLDRPNLSVTNETFAALGRVTETQVLPKGFELELLTGHEDDETTKNVWSVRLRVPGTVIPGGTTCITIHEMLLSIRSIGEEERKVIHAWQEKERAQGGIRSFERMEYKKEREAAAAIAAKNQRACQIAGPMP